MKAITPANNNAAKIVPMTAAATVPVLFVDFAPSDCEDIEDELVDVAMDPVGVVLATTAAPKAKPSYGNANA